jgi:hypothetical protein
MSKKATTTNIAAQQFANDTVQQLDALFKTRENWETTDFKKSNEGLYSLLAECLGVFDATFTKASDDERRALRSELTAKLSAAGVKVQNNSSSLTLLVRYVFNSDRKRAHGYATVLMAAITDGVSPANLPAYIVAAGGVEEIKRRQVKSAEAIAKQQKLEIAKADLTLEMELAAASMPLATVHIEGVTGTYALLLVKPTLYGTAAVVGALSELPESMVKALIARMAKVRVNEQQQAELTNKADKDILAAALKASNDDQMLDAA